MMNYSTIGNGQPLVLIHGFGEDSRIWEQQVEVLQLSCRLVIPDLPGAGKSPLTLPLSIDSMADGILAILDKEKIEKAIIIGHSMGGYITLAFAEKYPGRLKGFGLIHSTAYADNPVKKEARLKNIEFIRQHGSATFLASTFPNLFALKNRSAMVKTIENLACSNAYIPSAALIAFTEAMMARPDRREILRNIKIPVLFIVGQEDQAVPFADSMQQVYLPDLSYIHILKQSGHMGMLEENEKCTQAILQFVQMVR
ncbi:alpha/beta fold hydrolase [Flavihumibacter profundi]|jgi:pimeloyl-ACP methyl ester carboxylesterase|uniref:alpha/beta fold hydrolase n=1 Tax=Flavihumibacter profundi TaxID=2716883 RepID=UPI001CC4D730|nr:alpha/beta hydrolase [Flavihumibacter profundi]MBZ5857132.1 alpha/beta hydrolase [Flavihumibacter profundi]